METAEPAKPVGAVGMGCGVAATPTNHCWLSAPLWVDWTMFAPPAVEAPSTSATRPLFADSMRKKPSPSAAIFQSWLVVPLQGWMTRLSPASEPPPLSRTLASLAWVATLVARYRPLPCQESCQR